MLRARARVCRRSINMQLTVGGWQARSAAARRLLDESMYWLGEAAEHHGTTIREVWYWSARVFQQLATHPKAQRVGLDGEIRSALLATSRIDAAWDVFDCYRDRRAWQQPQL
jgi:hypothetical protein